MGKGSGETKGWRLISPQDTVTAVISAAQKCQGECKVCLESLQCQQFVELFDFIPSKSDPSAIMMGNNTERVNQPSLHSQQGHRTIIKSSDLVLGAFLVRQTRPKVAIN